MQQKRLMINLEQYRENADKNNLCAEYSKTWDACKSNKQIIDMALGVKGIDYLCDTIAKGWGISPEIISERFKSFINGKYISNQKGYTSKMYCRFSGEINADTTILALIDCDVNVCLPSSGISEIYCTGVCHIHVSGKGRAVFVCYGNPDNILVTGTCENMKRINKKNRDNYGG